MSVFKRGRTWWVTVSHAGQRVRVSAGKGATKGQAKELEAKIRGDIHTYKLGKQPDRLLSEALLKWLDGDCQSLKSAKKFESHARALLPYVKGKTLQQAPEVAEDIKQSMKVSPATINRRLAILRRVVNLAHDRWGWLDAPIGKKIQLLQERNERHIYLLPKEVEALAEACPNPAAGDMVRLAAFTGLRRGELFSLTKKHLRNRCIVLSAQTKTGRPRTVPVPKHILPICKRLPLEVSDAQLRHCWDSARLKVKMPHLHFHDLRHTYASWLVQSGASLRVVQELLGHTSLAMTQRYAHLAPENLRDAVKVMVAKIR